MGPQPTSTRHLPAARFQSDSTKAADDGEPTAEVGLRLPRPELPEAGVGRIGRHPPGFDTLPSRLFAVVGGWTSGAVAELPVMLRDELVRELTECLIDPRHRETYIGRFRSARAALVGGRVALASRASAGFSVEEFAASGVGCLNDVAVAALALDPLHLEATADLIDQLAEGGELGRAWWDALARAGSAAYPEVDPRVLCPAATVTPPRSERANPPSSDWKMRLPVRE